MPSTSSTIKKIHVESSDDLRTLFGSSPQSLLEDLQQPTWITIKGQDRTRSRAIVTLLHANEPSGLKAIHKLISDGLVPETNLGIFIASVEAALYPPTFSHRYLPGEKDLNRCFGLTRDSDSASLLNNSQHQLTDNFIELLQDFTPEAVVDTHNTSGHSDAFAVATNHQLKTRQVTQLFTHQLVYLDQSLGTLIEQPLDCPIVTVEFGGFLDPTADQIALTSLEQFITKKQLFSGEVDKVQILPKPQRLMVTDPTKLQYASSLDHSADLTIFNTIDQLNFRPLGPDTQIGWMQQAHIEKLIVDDSQTQKNIAQQYFRVEAGMIVTTTAMTIFMATTDSAIAKNDCLLYFCPESNT